MRLIDTHTHLDFDEFDADRQQVIQRSHERGVERLVVLGVYQENWKRVWHMAETEPGVYAALGLHPMFIDRYRPEHLVELYSHLEQLADDPKLCAIGEIGLDFYLGTLDRERQQAVFDAQLHMARTFDLPVLIHARRSHAAVAASLKRNPVPRGGIVHAFSGSAEEARNYIKLGFKLGLGGAATWPQALRMHKVLPGLPLGSIVLETDSPDMAPAMYPGQRNSPEHLPEICIALAGLLGVSPQALAEASSANACALFGW